MNERGMGPVLQTAPTNIERLTVRRVLTPVEWIELRDDHAPPRVLVHASLPPTLRDLTHLAMGVPPAAMRANAPDMPNLRVLLIEATGDFSDVPFTFIRTALELAVGQLDFVGLRLSTDGRQLPGLVEFVPTRTRTFRFAGPSVDGVEFEVTPDVIHHRRGFAIPPLHGVFGLGQVGSRDVVLPTFPDTSSTPFIPDPLGLAPRRWMEDHRMVRTYLLHLYDAFPGRVRPTPGLLKILRNFAALHANDPTWGWDTVQRMIDEASEAQRAGPGGGAAAGSDD